VFLTLRTTRCHTTLAEELLALLNWNELTWTGFLAGVEGFRDNFAGKSRDDVGYFRALEVIQEVPLRSRSSRSGDLVLTLNRWACRLSSAKAPGLIADWITAHLDELEPLERMSIADVELPDRAERLGDLHDGLIAAARAGGVHNMSDAAASKTLHLLVPGLFVMWDKEIRRSAPDGYATFMLQMNAAAVRLAAEAPVPAAEVEEYLQRHLGYPGRKTLAKYLDEFNWYEAVGREQLAAR